MVASLLQAISRYYTKSPKNVYFFLIWKNFSNKKILEWQPEPYYEYHFLNKQMYNISGFELYFYQ